MGVIKGKVLVQRPNEDSRSSDDDELIILSNNNPSGYFTEEDEVIRIPRRQQETRFHKRQSLSSKGHTLTLKKGRRSRHRFENEQLLTTNEDELIWDVVDRTPNSPKFSSLDEETMSRFYYGDFENFNEERHRKPKNKVSYEPEDFDPEVAYLNIGFNLRTALKKNLPMGMLARLERDIINFFTENPQSSFIAEELSSYERLLAHACSSYHCLYSYSFNESGKRKLKIANPNQIFYKPDPSLSLYLQERFHKQ